MDVGSPASRYYSALVGRWEGRFRIRIARRDALGELPLATRLTGLAAHLTGEMRMRTTLEGEGRRFVHTTEVSAFGVTAFTTEETIELDEDGRGLLMRGVQRARLGPTETYEAKGSIDDSATRATYHLRWLGSDLVQRTRIVPEGLELTQETPWSRGEVLLRRREDER